MARKKPDILLSFLSKKASSLRSSWKKRSLRYPEKMGQLPTTKEIKEWLLEKYPFICEYDNIQLRDCDTGFDHNVPLSRNGDLYLDNIIICHKLHNLSKGDLTGKEYRSLLCLIRQWPDKGEKFLSRLRQTNTIYKRRARNGRRTKK